MKIVLPVAGRGTRFEPLTDWLPKCLVPVRQRPLISWAVANLAYEPHELAVVANERERHILEPAIDAIFGRRAARVWTQDTAGAAHTVMKAREHFDNDEPLLIITPDLVWQASLEKLHDRNADAGLVVTRAFRHEPVALQRKYSYCDADEHGQVVRVVEKPDTPLRLANIGVYWWRRGADFAQLASAYLRSGDTTRGEKYVAPIYNLAIAESMNVFAVEAEEYVNLGDADRAAAWEGWK